MQCTPTHRVQRKKGRLVSKMGRLKYNRSAALNQTKPATRILGPRHFPEDPLTSRTWVLSAIHPLQISDRNHQVERLWQMSPWFCPLGSGLPPSRGISFVYSLPVPLLQPRGSDHRTHPSLVSRQPPFYQYKGPAHTSCPHLPNCKPLVGCETVSFPHKVINFAKTGTIILLLIAVFPGTGAEVDGGGIQQREWING